MSALVEEPVQALATDVAISLHNICMRFTGARTLALDHINAAVPYGDITGLVGPDAAGKTTLMRILAGLLLPTMGEVCILGKLPEQASTAGEIGYMPQRFGLYEDLSVYDNLCLHARLRGVEGQAQQALFGRLLQFTGLTRFTKRLAGNLSGGMKQKLGIACSLLGSPRVLLLDEPGVGVDPLSRRELWQMVQELRDGGMTIIWSTAYLEEAERCPHVIMLDAGRTLHVGAPQTLTKTVAGRVFHIPHSATSDTKSLLAQWIVKPGVADALIQGNHVRVVLQEYASAALRATLAEQNARPIAPCLEDAYMSALGGISQKPSPFSAGKIAYDTNQPPVRIEARGLTKRYGDFVAAHDINFSVKAGQIFGLLGPNGAGKSTTFRMLCGLSHPTEGQCYVDGVNLGKASSKARARLGYMAQKFSLYGDITVVENIKILADLYGLSKPQQKIRIPELVEALDLQEHLQHVTKTLPLGQKQRLALLCATLHNPPVLFLDEPTSGVDACTRRDFWKHITAMTSTGTAVLVTTHFMEEAEYCDAIALVYQGRIISSGTPDELKMHAPHSSAAPHEHDGITLEEAFIAYIEAYAHEGHV